MVLIAIAKALGYKDAAKLLVDTLAEEKATDVNGLAMTEVNNRRSKSLPN